MAPTHGLKSLLYLTLFFPPYALAANILFFFPASNLSQKNSVWPLAIALANNGHNVTFLSPQTKSFGSHPNVTDLAPQVLQNLVSPLYHVDRFQVREQGREKDFDYVGISIDVCKILIDSIKSDTTFSQIFHDSKFDLVVVNILLGECGYYLSHRLKSKVVTFLPGTFIPFFYDTYGVPDEVGWVPDILYKFDTYPLTFSDRIFNVFMPAYWGWARSNRLSPALEEIVKPLFPNDPIPTLFELENNVSMVLINSHPATDFARIMPPLFVDVGGLSIWGPQKKIPQEFKVFMDEAGSGGVVLITFGSTVLLNTVSERHQAMFFHLIRTLPTVRFLMRWKGSLPEFLDFTPKNLMVSEWLPQREILGHPKLKIFITHGGISSIQEATFYSVPMIAIPLFSDQDYNSYRIDAQEVGLRVEIRGMTGDTLVDAVRKILHDDRYKTNMMKKSAIFRDRPQTPVETALFWTEFALRHNDTISTFRPSNRHLNVFQRRHLDVYLVLFVTAILVTIVAYFLVKKAVCFLAGLMLPQSKLLVNKSPHKKGD